MIGIRTEDGRRIRLRVRICHVQVASLAPRPDREAADHLGVCLASEPLRVYAQYRYKILFLDVLFPMDLDKVIFVDAGE